MNEEVLSTLARLPTRGYLVSSLNFLVAHDHIHPGNHNPSPSLTPMWVPALRFSTLLQGPPVQYHPHFFRLLKFPGAPSPLRYRQRLVGSRVIGSLNLTVSYAPCSLRRNPPASHPPASQALRLGHAISEILIFCES